MTAFMRPGSFVVIMVLLWTCASSAGDARSASDQATVEVGRITAKSLVEASGLAASRRHADVYWTHNDGSDGVLHAVKPDGSTIARLKVKAKFSDWEDVAIDA